MKRNVVLTLMPVFGMVVIFASVIAATPGHGYISIPAPAFRPQAYTYQYSITSLWVRNLDGNSDYFYAPLELPNGATITKLTFYWSDSSTSADGYCTLSRGNLQGSYGLGMAAAYTSGDTGDAASSEDISIELATVDNSQYGYILTVYLPDSGVEAYGVIVEYTFQTSLPLIKRNSQ